MELVANTEEFEKRLDAVADALLGMVKRNDGPVFKAMGVWLAEVILEDERGGAVVERTPWDHSSRGVRSSESFDLSLYETVGEFLDQEHTGQTIATYCSGAGLAAETFGDAFTQNCLWPAYGDGIRELAADLIDDDGSVPDEVLDGLVMRDVGDCHFEQAFKELPLLETFTKHLQAAIASRAEEAKRQRMAAAEKKKQQDELRTFAGDLVPEIQGTIAGVRYEKSNWGQLLAYLNSLVEIHGKKRVAAAMAFVSVKASNSVSAELKIRFSHD